MNNLIYRTTLERVHAPVAAGTSNITDCNVVDMQNYDAVRFIVSFGTLTSTAVTSLSLKQSDAITNSTTLSGAEDAVGSSVTVVQATGSNKLYYLDVMRPVRRYLQLQINRGTANAVVDLAIAEKYAARKVPTTQLSDVDGGKVLISPIAGTP